MSFKDVFKNSFMNSVNMADLSVSQIVTIFGVTLLFALYIFFIYRILTRKNFYNKSYNTALAAVALITAAVIITIQSLSLIHI